MDQESTEKVDSNNKTRIKKFKIKKSHTQTTNNGSKPTNQEDETNETLLTKEAMAKEN